MSRRMNRAAREALLETLERIIAAARREREDRAAAAEHERAMRRAHDAGRLAAIRRETNEANPHPVGTPSRAAWRRGWLEERMAMTGRRAVA